MTVMLASTGAKTSETHPNRLLVDGYEVYLPPRTTVVNRVDPLLGDRQLIVTIPLASEPRVDESIALPTVQGVTEFVSGVSDIVTTVMEQQETAERMAMLTADHLKQAFQRGACAGVRATIVSIQNLAAKHLAP